MRGLWIGLILPWVIFAMDGERVYEQKCASCHQRYIPADVLMKNFMEQNNRLLHLKAPTINQLAYRLKQRIGDPTGDKEIQLMEVTSFIHDYILEPDRSKSICVPEVLAHFETMPSLKGKIHDEEIEAVSEWIYFYMPPIKEPKVLKFVDFKEAKALAKAQKKIIMVEVTRPTCHYCIKMERTTLSDPEVVSAIMKDFIPVRVDVSQESLPDGLEWRMTPTFLFIDYDGTLIKSIPGAWMKEDFLKILEEVKGDAW
jgi:thioredoxin-related protein